MKTTRVRLLAAAAIVATVALSLLQCGGGPAMVGVSGPDAGPVHTTWASCLGPLDNSCNTPQALRGKKPSCAASGACGSDYFCWFVENPGTVCFPHDVAYCDWTPDGALPQCNQLEGGWPADAAGCGTLQCVPQGDGATCGWSTTCTAPAAP
jgi:hypothetical protein